MNLDHTQVPCSKMEVTLVSPIKFQGCNNLVAYKLCKEKQSLNVTSIYANFLTIRVFK